MNEATLYVLTTNGLLFLLSVIFYYVPPKTINNWYGYRTPKAMQNKDIWQFANMVFNKNLLLYAAISFVAGLLLANITTQPLTWQPMALVFLSILVAIIKTEKSLKDTFTDEGERK